jgi:hypothetical protein
MSDDNEFVAKCQSDDESCMTCGEAYCNFQTGSATIECLACSSDENSACGYQLSPGQQNTTKCTELVSRSNLCVAFRSGTTFHRGCLNDFQLDMINVTSCIASDDCETCEDDNCNYQQIVREECYECDGNCDSDQAAVGCRGVTFEKSGCYHYENGEMVSFSQRP